MGNSQILLSGTSSMRKDDPASIVETEVDNEVLFVDNVVDKDGDDMCVGEVIHEFLECSLKGTKEHIHNTKTDITILLGSDEQDTTYRQSIIDLVDNHFPHVSIIDVDQLTAQVVQGGIESGLIDEGFVNNYYIYELQKVLRKEYNFSSFFLDKHRSSCPKCVPVLERIHQHEYE